MTGKRRRGSEGDVVGISRLRREEIDSTIQREQSKRKWVDDLDAPSPIDFSTDVQWSRENQRPTSKKASYLYPWIPIHPPWYTLRVYKKYAPGGEPKRRRRRYYSEGQIQGLENFLSNHDPPFNAFCLDDLRDSLPSLDTATGHFAPLGDDEEDVVL
ncbi:MAG: hypothetical protein Q9195_003714 [Heterodermia aff. obscurata]